MERRSDAARSSSVILSQNFKNRPGTFGRAAERLRPGRGVEGGLARTTGAAEKRREKVKQVGRGANCLDATDDHADGHPEDHQEGQEGAGRRPRSGARGRSELQIQVFRPEPTGTAGTFELTAEATEARDAAPSPWLGHPVPELPHREILSPQVGFRRVTRLRPGSSNSNRAEGEHHRWAN